MSITRESGGALLDFCYHNRMTADLWRDRLRQEVKRDGRSAHALSQALGWGPNEVKRVLKSDASVKVDAIFALCREIGIDPSYIFSGYSLEGPLQEFLGSEMARDPRRVQALLDALSLQSPKTPEA